MNDETTEHDEHIITPRRSYGHPQTRLTTGTTDHIGEAFELAMGIINDRLNEREDRTEREAHITRLVRLFKDSPFYQKYQTILRVAFTMDTDTHQEPISQVSDLASMESENHESVPSPEPPVTAQTRQARTGIRGQVQKPQRPRAKRRRTISTSTTTSSPSSSSSASCVEESEGESINNTGHPSTPEPYTHEWFRKLLASSQSRDNHHVHQTPAPANPEYDLQTTDLNGLGIAIQQAYGDLLSLNAQTRHQTKTLGRLMWRAKQLHTSTQHTSWDDWCKATINRSGPTCDKYIYYHSITEDHPRLLDHDIAPSTVYEHIRAWRAYLPQPTTTTTTRTSSH
jgi:hypothetical protein